MSLPTNVVTSILCLAITLLLDVCSTSVRMGDGFLNSRTSGLKVHHELGRYFEPEGHARKQHISKGHLVGVRCAGWPRRSLPQLFPLLDQQDKTARRLFSL